MTSLKKDGSVRICLDARKLNDIMMNDYECAEPTEVLFQRCGGRKIISTMDLKSSFWQIPLAEEFKKYTTFLHESKCYEFYVTPFGIKTSTAALVRALDSVLNGLGNFYLTFIDDIFCSSENVNQHLLHLELLFHRLMKNKLTINLEKSHFSHQNYLQTDASDVALGAILFQLDEVRKPCPIIYSHRTLEGAELAYHTTEKELLAIVWALQKFRSYIMGDGLLYFVNGENKCLCLTKGIVYDIIDKCHEMYAHIGPLKVMKMLNDFFYYPKMAKIVRRRLASCDSCQRNKVTNQTSFSEMKNYQP